MEIELRNINKIFVLGAGASAEYGLPMWDELVELIKEKLQDENFSEDIQFKKEILEWVDKVGEGKEYSTIDKCIQIESDTNSENGNDIEKEFFYLIQVIFEEKFRNNKDTWITELNRLFLKDEIKKKEIFFINYNYDIILQEEFLNFNFLSVKRKEGNNREKIESLNNNNLVQCFVPHGSFLERIGVLYKHLNYIGKTFKTDGNYELDAISCYDSDDHYYIQNREDRYKRYEDNNFENFDLFILGLGGGLEYNLKKIQFNNPKDQFIDNIFITIQDESKQQEIKKFLNEKFLVPENNIFVFKDCKQLIQEYGTVKWNKVDWDNIPF